MIYPTFAAVITDVGEYCEAERLARRIGFQTELTRTGPIIFDGTNRRTIEAEIPFGTEEVSPEEFIERLTEICDNIYEFAENIQIGDSVIVIERNGACNDYPMGFAEKMTKYSGKTVTISAVYERNCCVYKFSNGSDRVFSIVEDNGEYTWHSSMFEPNYTQISRIELSELPLIL